MDEDSDDEADLTVVGDRKSLVGPTRRSLAHIVVLAGRQLGEAFKVDHPAVLGRGGEADIRINDDEISRRHARLDLRKNNEVWIEDLGSRNGTFVNGERIVSAELKDGDKIQLGATTILKFTYHDDLEAEFQRRMYDAALRDPLTQLFNRRHFLERLNTEVAFSKRHNAPLALLLFDIDHFKRINDEHGHPAGDFVLVTLATEVARQLRAEDLLARYGGEEFVVLARGVDLEHGSRLAERLRASVEVFRFEHAGKRIPVTISVGIAALPTPDLADSESLVQASDKAMYLAKNGGRNRVAAHKP